MYDITFGGGWAGGSSGGGGTTSSPTTTGPNYLDWLNFALQGYSTYANVSSSKKANEQNVALARENRAWEEKMSNSAIQRRKADIIAAGGNPALAFTNGSEASTPSVQPAQVQPPRFDAPRVNTGLALANAQLDNIKAQTYNTSADTRIKKTQGEILEQYGGANSAADLKGKENALSLFDTQVRKATAEAEISETTASLLRQQKEAAIKLLEAQARMGDINADSSEAIAKTLGVAGKDLGTVGKFFFELMKLLALPKGTR